MFSFSGNSVGPGVGMIDRPVARPISRRAGGDDAVKAVVEDRFDRAIGAGTDIECPVASRLDAGLTKGFDQTDDPQAGAEALLPVGAIGEDLFAQQRRAWPDRFGLARYPLDGPVGEPPVRRRHMLRDAGVPAIARPARMGGDAFALVVQLDRPRRDPGLDRLTREAIRDPVVMALDLDVIIEPGAPRPPFGEHIRLQRQRLQSRLVDRLEHLAAGPAIRPHDPAVVEIGHQLGDRGVEFSETVKHPVAQPSEQPALDDQHASFDLAFVARPPRQRSSAPQCRCPTPPTPIAVSDQSAS